MNPLLSIVIPAHDEGTLIHATLSALLADAAPGEFEVVVVANGCSDDTAAQASRIAGVRVIEIDTPSKIAALNEGDLATHVFPRVYLDADVAVSTATVRRVAEALASRGGQACVAAPTLRVDATAATLPVRCHTRVWELSDYRRNGHVGSGLYAVNEAGRARWGRFPDVIADDRFVQTRFDDTERVTVATAFFTVAAPATMRALVRRGVRIERGNRQLAGGGGGSSSVNLLRRVIARPTVWASFPFYAWGYLIPKLRARRSAPGTVAWDRDPSLREAARV